MPWVVGPQHCSDYRSEQQCRRTSLAFYQAVRDQLPVWLLEDMRSMEALHWEEGRAATFTPSEALLYSLVHDHQPYARHLLARFSVRALEPPGPSFRCCATSAAPHLALAVRHNRLHMLRMILDTARHFGSEERQEYLDNNMCPHDVHGGKSAVHVACDLVRPECVLLLLAHGASPYVTDLAGECPLDCVLQQICKGPSNLETDVHRTLLCLGYLLLFMPKVRFQRQDELRSRAELWRTLVGEETFSWLAALSPPPLFVQAMQSLSRSVSAEQLDSLPDFLKPLDFRLQQDATL